VSNLFPVSIMKLMLRNNYFSEKDVGDDRKVVSRDRGRPASGWVVTQQMFYDQISEDLFEIMW